MLKPNSTLLVFFIFLAVTTSVPAISVFTQSVLNDWSTELRSNSHHAKPVIDATGK